MLKFKQGRTRNQVQLLLLHKQEKRATKPSEELKSTVCDNMDILGVRIQELMESGLPSVQAPFISVVCTVLALLAGILGYFCRPYWCLRKVPGPPALPLIGHLHLLAKYGPDVFSFLAKTYGPIFRDSRWSAMRNTILSVYQPSHLAKLIPTMQSFIESATQNVESEGDMTFSDLSLRLANDIIGQAAFGVDFGLSKPQSDNHVSHQQNDNEVQDFINQQTYSTTQLKMDFSGSFSMILGLLVPILQEPFHQILKRIPGTTDMKVDQTDHKLTRRLDEIVEKRMKEKSHDSKDFLSLILSARETGAAAKHVFTPDYISAVAYEHLLAGTASTSFTLSSIIYLVAGHPEVEKKILREIDEFGPQNQVPTADDLQLKFPYIDQVIKETMRIYTFSPLVARETSTQVEIGGYILPKGTWVWSALGVLAKNPKNFPEPERFDPNCEEEKQRHPYANIPFGIGPRACIGKKFSLQELKLSLIHLYKKYIFRHSSTMEKPLELEYGIVLNFKHGIKVRAIKRT